MSFAMPRIRPFYALLARSAISMPPLRSHYSSLPPTLPNFTLQGRVLEERAVLYLLRIFGYPIPLGTIFDLHGACPEWADERAEVVGRLNAPANSVGETPESPGLSVVRYADNIKDVLHWIENPDDASAVLIPSNRFGPDVMMRCKLSSANSVVLLMGRLKACTGSLDVKRALTSLHEDHWFKKAPSNERQDLIDAIKRQPVLRFVTGYPVPPDLKSTAKPVVQALKALGPNVALGTLSLDTFRASFVSEQEARDVLVPLRQAMAPKHKNLARK